MAKQTPDQRKAVKRAKKLKQKSLTSATNESNDIERKLDRLRGVPDAFLRIRPRIDD